MADEPLDAAGIRQQAELQRMLEESKKFIAEREKLISEATKFAAEQHKLSAEALKLLAERQYFDRYPWQIVIASVTAGAALFAAAAAFVKLLG